MTSLIILILSLLLIVLFSAIWKVHPVPVLLGAGLFYGVLTGMKPEEAINGLALGFGETMGKIGFIIIAGTIIGVFMEQRGAVQLLAAKTLQITGKKHLPLATAGIGFFASIAIFCDSAFVILTGLCQKMCRKAGIPIAVGTGALAMGLLCSHCLYPPTPGPVAAVGLLNANMGLTIILGVITALIATGAGWLFAIWANRNVLTESEISQKNQENSPSLPTEKTLEPEETVYHGPLFWATFPILIPLLLILSASIYEFTPETFQTDHPYLSRGVLFLGIPAIALTFGAFLAVFTLGRLKKGELTVGGEIGKAIAQAAGILVITSSGGAFGKLLSQSTAESEWITRLASDSPWIILLPFAVSAFIKTAQGSSMVAMMTTAGIFAPLLETMGLDSEMMRALTVVAIGAGGLVVSHTNDSYFWVITQFTGFSVRQGLKIVTLASLVCGLTAAMTVVVMNFAIRAFA